MNDSDHCKSVIEQGQSPSLVIAIGSSAGGLPEVVKIVESLTQWFQGTVVLANHRPPQSVNRLRDILAVKAHVRVEEPADEDCLEKATIYVGHASDTVEVDGPEFDIRTDSAVVASQIHMIERRVHRTSPLHAGSNRMLAGP